jgi:hypothetical protein
MASRRASLLDSVLATQERFAKDNADALSFLCEDTATACHFCGEADDDVSSLPHIESALACSVLAHPSCVSRWVEARNAKGRPRLRCPLCRAELGGGLPQPLPRARPVCGTTMGGGVCLLPFTHLGPCVVSPLPSSN